MFTRSGKMVMAVLIALVMVVFPLLSYAATDTLIPAPIISGVTDGGEYSEAVTPTWVETEGTSSEATLSKDQKEPELFVSGTPISELGSYLLTLTMINEASGERISSVVSFTITEESVIEDDKSGESDTPENEIDKESGEEAQEEVQPKEDENTQEQEAVEEELEEDNVQSLEEPVIKGVKDGKSYEGTVKPSWKEEEEYSYEVLLEKDGKKVEGYEKGQEIWEGGEYQLTVLVQGTAESGEELEADASVSFTIEKNLYNTPNSGAEALKKKLQDLPANKQKMDISLLKLVDEEMLFEGESLSELKKGLQTQNILKSGGATRGLNSAAADQAYVYIHLDKKTPISAVQPYIKKIVNKDEKNHLLTGWVELDKLESLSSLQGVRKLSLVDKPEIQAVISQGDVVHKADQARSTFGQQGQGVKVGVISDSVDDWEIAKDRGELPEITVLENDYPEEYTHSDEGIALLEIIYDLAPQAELYFHDCGRDILDFNEAIKDLKEEGCQVIVDDVSWKHEPFFEDGTIASYVESITDEVIYVSSAGNYAQTHYQGEYYKYTAPGGSHFHDFSHGTSSTERSLLVKVPWNGFIQLIMQWDEPFEGAGEDYDLWVYDQTNKAYISDVNGYTFPTGFSQTYGSAVQDGNDDPLESFVWANNNLSKNPLQKDIDLAITVTHPTGESEANIELFLYPYYGAYAQEVNLVAEDSIFGHPAAQGVIAVGAIDAADEGNDEIREYSSQGPVTIRGEATKRLKPDLCGVDGVTVTWGSATSTTNFQGTSAAAPHVAAIAALLKAEYPTASPEAIRQVLKDSAIHFSSEPNGVFGYGLADALAALQTYDNTPPTVTVDEQTVTVAPLQAVSVQVDEASDVYVIKDGAIPTGESPTRDNLEDTLDSYLGAKGVAAAAGSNVNISSTRLVPGTYHVYAIDGFNNISAASTNPIHVVASALYTASTVAADKTTIQLGTNDRATFTVQLMDSVGQGAGYNWIYVTSSRALDTITQVAGATQPFTEDGNIRFLAGEDGIVQFAVEANVEGTSRISVGLGSDAVPLIGSAIELKFWALPAVSVLDRAATDAENQYIRLTSNRATGEVYLVRNDMPRTTLAELEAAAAGNKGEKGTVTAADTIVQVPTTGLLPGVYYAYASYDSYLSSPAPDTVTITDGTKPLVATDGGNYTNSGESVAVASNEETGKIYIVRDNITSITIASFDSAVAKHEAASVSITATNTPAAISTNNLRGGTYLAYATDGAGNISEPGGNAIIITDILPPVIASFYPANNAANVAVSANIAITFSEPVLYLGDTEITTENLASLIILHKTDAQGEAVPCSVTINPLKTVITIDPIQDLIQGQIYYLALNPLVEDEGGNALTGVTTVTFTTVKPSPGGNTGGGGGGGGTPTKLLKAVTPDDYLLEKELRKTGQARLNLTSYGQEMASFSGQVIQQLREKNIPLLIEREGVIIDIPSQFLSNLDLTSEGRTVDIRVRRINDNERPGIQGDTAFTSIGAAIYELSAQIRDSNGTVSSAGTFTQPVVVSISLAGVNLSAEQVTKIKGVRFEQDPSGKFILKSLGGNYNSQNQTFSFATDHFSLYSIMIMDTSVQGHSQPHVIELTIAKTEARINGVVQQVDVPPVLINDRTMVPLRFIGEALGAQFIWAESSRTVYLVLGSKNLRLLVGEKLEGLDSPPVIIAGRTMVPIRYIAEAFGAKVEWREATKTVLIFK